MQGTVADNSSALRSDESIKFRPSPNFKHMKKYLKSKFDEESNLSASNKMTESVSQTEQKIKITMEAKIQPPLPPNSPPPDSPVTIKQEIEDDDYQFINANTAPDTAPGGDQTPPPVDPPNIDEAEATNEIMCRNFIRGTCKKGSACIFVHKLIKSQLPGVYTFCRNFQNRQCGFAKCKFVHATVFEKEHFFRTGKLPPHAIAHLYQPSPTVPPPPPPPPPPEEPVQVEPQIIPRMFANVPIYEPNATAQTILNCPTIPINDNLPEVFQFGISDSTTSSYKREWTDSEDLSRSPHDPDSSEPPPKRCKDCDSNSFRYQYFKNKVEEMLISYDERKQKIAQINKKYQRLCTVLMTLFKPMAPPGNNNIMGSTLNTGIDKDKGVLEQMNMLLAANNNKQAMFGEDSSKGILEQINLLLAANNKQSTSMFAEDNAKIQNFLGNMNF